MSTSGAIKGAYSLGSRPSQTQVFSRSARRRSAGSSAPKRWRPHSAIGCKGVFCKSCDDDHSTKVWASRRASGVTPRRDATCRCRVRLPTSANWPSPLTARSNADTRGRAPLRARRGASRRREARRHSRGRSETASSASSASFSACAPRSSATNRPATCAAPEP